MMIMFLRFFGSIVLSFFILVGKAQVVTVTNPTNTTPNLAATYTSMANAITALNTITSISGPVTITLNAGNPQTAPAGGYTIQFSAVTTAATPITITGNNNIITTNGSLTSGSITDAVFKLIGVDFITLRQFVMQENAANTTTAVATNNMTEWGVALLYASTTNGSQNNTIQNNSIALNKIYRNTFGIYSNTNHSSTVPTISAPITNLTGSNSNNKYYSNTISNVNMGIAVIGSSVDGFMDTGNDVGGSSLSTGNNITNWGGQLQASVYVNSSGSCYGVFINNQKNENVSNNSMVSSAVSGATVAMRGVFKEYSNVPSGTFSTTISNNTVTIINNFTSGVFDGIRTQGISSALSTATLNITGNLFLNNSIGAVSSGVAFVGITNTNQVGILNINDNIIRGTTSTATTGSFTGISNTGSVVTTLNINNNKIGDASGDAITFSAINNMALSGITVPNVSTTASVSISGNNFKGIVHTQPSTGAFTFINLVHSPSGGSTDNINSNTFTNIVSNTSGNLNFIIRSGTMALNAGHTENCNNNSIITGFSKSGGGTVTIYSASSASFSGNNMVQTGNNFSNITLTGSTVMAGWNNSEGSTTQEGPVKTISNNIFSNWVVGASSTATVLPLTIANSGGGTLVSDNTISGISVTGSALLTTTLVGINVSSGNRGTSFTCSGNTITGLSNPGSSGAISGISCSSPFVTTLTLNNNSVGNIVVSASNFASAIRVTTNGQTVNIFKNKIYDISCSSNSSAAVANGIETISTVTGSAWNIHNNLIGDIRSTQGDGANMVRGISIVPLTAPLTTTYAVYYNSIYLNASSTGTTFGSSCIFTPSSGTSTTASLILRNNILVNTSTANGTGLTVCLRRTLSNLSNFALSSNNNILYTGTVSASNLIYYDGTNSDQTLASYKTRVSTRETNSLTELPPFLSLVGAAANFLHLNPTVPTQAESGAVNITGYTDDFDNQIRQGNAGYGGAGTAPDIGADELEGTFTELNPPVITYTTLTTPTCIFGNRTITGVTITDATGIPLSGANRPRIYYRRNAGSWFSQPGTNTAGTATNSTWSFTIVSSDMGTLSGGDSIFYYIIAQDNIGTANTASSPSAGLAATGVNAVTTAPTLPNVYTLLYNLSGTYTVGAGGNFTTLTAAVAAYNNACSLAGAIIFELTDNTYSSETYPIGINNHADASITNTLTIRPSASAVPVLTNPANTVAFVLNGAKFIRFDGRQEGAGSGRFLTVTNTGGGITVQFINDAQDNIIQNCIIKGQRVSAFSGTIVFSTAGTGSGNDNNTINNNEINEAGGFSNNAIYSSGTAFQGNDNITISNNLISDYYNSANDCHGIFINTLNSASNWNISNNRFFQTANRLFTVGVSFYGIRISTGSGYTINNNTIGFSNESGTGLMNLVGNSVSLTGFPTSYSVTGTATLLRFIGIACDFTLLGSISSIDANTIGGISVYSSASSASSFGQFCGIYIENGPVNIGSTAGNIIGSASSKTSVYLVSGHAGSNGLAIGIRVVSEGSSFVQNNIIGGILASGNTNTKQVSFTGISMGGLCKYTAGNNQIGNSIPENIQLGFAATAGLVSNTGSLQSTTGFSTACSGILLTGTGNAHSITQNTLQGWVLSASSTAVMGISSFATLAGSFPSININNNALGTDAAGWVRYKVVNSAALNGIYSLNQNAYTGNVTGNDIRGITYESTLNNTGFTNLIYNSSANNPLGTANTSNNTYTNLNLQGFTFFLESGTSMAAGSVRIIDNNRTVGTTTISNGFIGIDMIGSSTVGSALIVTNNNFSNISFDNTQNVLFSGQSILYNDREGTNTPGIHPAKKIAGNIFSAISGSGGTFTVMSVNKFGSATLTDSLTRNLISNITLANGKLTGISLGANATSGSNEISIDNNEIKDLSATGALSETIGIHIINTGNSTVTNIRKNLLHGFSAAGSSSKCAGIVLSSLAVKVHVRGNKIYDVASSGASATAQGINIGYGAGLGAGVDQVLVYNNLVGEISTPLSGNAAGPSVEGISIADGNTISIYNNTVYLTASSSDAFFSSAAVYTNTGSDITLYNNILCNLSIPGISGQSVAHWRENNNFVNLDANYNDLYAGTASAAHLIYYDGTNSNQTLSAYQTVITPSETNAVNALPVFISTITSDITYLHIDPLLNCTLAKNGNNQLDNLSDDYDGEARMNVSPWIIDIGADEATKLIIWSGAINSNWNNPGNWTEGIVPNALDHTVVISNPPAVQPVIAPGDVFQIANLIIEPGATLNNRGTIKVTGTISGTAAVNNVQAGVVEGSVELNGNCNTAQAISGKIFTGNAVKDFIMSNDVVISSVTGEQVNISGALSFGPVTGKVLSTGGNVTLVSTASETARTGDLTNNSITGQVTAERYINTGTGGGRHPKSWQFLSIPTKGQTIFQSWQENGSAPAGFGTIITGTGTGFDIATTEPSMKFFDPVIGTSGNWSPVTNTGNLIYDQRGYLVFVRGDRSVTTSGGAPNPTILRTKGTLFQPNDPPPVTNVIAGKLASVGNPYASSINVEYMRDNGLFINLNNDVIVWDPLVYGTYGYGGYQTLSAANDYEPTSGGTAYYPAGVSAPVLQSGQAFFVRSSGPAGTVTFTEACKENSSRLVNRSTTARAGKQYLRALLCTNSGVLADGNAVVFHSDYRNGIDADDGVKLINTGENFGIYRDGSPLSVEARKKVNRNDTVFYFISNLRKQSYQLKFAPKNLYNGRLEAFLADRYLHLETAISLTDSSIVNISINNDPASSAADRFYVIFRQRRMAPAGIIAVSAQRREDETAVVRWNVSNEIDILRYEVERSTDGNVFKPIVTKFPSANNGVLVLYDYLDENAGTGELFYRIRMQDTDGNIQYSNVVKLDALQQMPAFSVYPNPVADRNIRIYFSHIPEGRYILQLINAAGQQVYQTTMNLSEGSQIKDWKVDHTVAAGNYHLKIVSPGDRTSVLTVVLR